MIIFTAPSSPLLFHAVPDMTTVLLSWATPLSPREVLNYTVTCVPLSEGVDPLTVVYNEAGSYTLRGFRPATAYNCSIVATNYIGNSAPSITNIITVDESESFIVQNKQIYSSLMKLY